MDYEDFMAQSTVLQAAKAALATKETQEEQLLDTYERSVYERHLTAEKTITPLLQDISQKYNVSLTGLDHRLKTIKSLDEKLHKRSAQAVSIDTVKDIVRYTVIIPDEQIDQYVDITRQIIEKLSTDPDLRFRNETTKNWWTSDKDSYVGINTTFRTIDGCYFEVQFTQKHLLKLKTGLINYMKL